jgi:hypothetical protein
MESVKQQYLSLKEGKMNQAQFMRNVRMSLPQYITNLSSFEDTVKILRNKGILTEADIKDKEKRKLSLKLVDKKDKKGLALYKNTEDQNDLYYYDGKVLYSVVDGDRKGPSVRMSLYNITGLQ